MTTSLPRKIYNHTVGRTIYKRRYVPRSTWDYLKDYLESDRSGKDDGMLVNPAFEAPERYRDVFGASLSEYLDQDMKSDGHETWIAILEQGRIDTDTGSSIAVFNRHNELLGDVSFQFVKRPTGGYDHGPVRQNNVFHRPYLTRPKQIKGTVMSLLTGGGGNANFYHWFVDVLSRLAVLKASPWARRVDYFLVPNTTLPFQLESLELLGIPPEKVINGMEHPHIEADHLVVTSHPRTTTYHIPQYLTDFLHEAFSDLDIEQDPGLRDHAYIYINRGDAPKRKVLNEPQVEEALAAFGFKSLSLSDYSLRQAIQLFKHAEMIVAPHGAGLTNLIFCDPGTRVLELFSDKFVNHYFYELASNLHLLYDFMVGTPVNDKVITTRYEGIEEDMLIDLDALLSKIREVRSAV